MSDLSHETGQPQPVPEPNLRRTLLIAAAVMIGTTVVFFGLFVLFSNLTEQAGLSDTSNAAIINVQGGEEFDGSTAYDPPRNVPDFTLTSHTGENVSLSDYRGRAVLMFFGFTHCPDVCPLTLEEFGNIRDVLGEDAADVEFVFISVDGSRDTPEALGAYLERRRVEFVTGLTGPEDEIERIGTDDNLFFEIDQTRSNDQNYIINHTANSFLIDTEGRLVMKFAFQTDPQIVADHIRTYVQ